MKNSKFWYTLFLILAGVVVGSLAASLAEGVSWLSWIGFGLRFGMENPFVLNLGILDLTFAVSINLTVSVIIFVLLALFLGRLIDKR